MSVFRLYCNWFVSVFTLLSVSINLFYLSPGPRGGPALHHRVPPPQRAPSLVDLEQLEGAPGAVVLPPRLHLMQIIPFPVMIILFPVWPVIQKLLSFQYFTSSDSGRFEDKSSLLESLQTFLTDSYYSAPVRETLELMVEAGAKIYSFVNTHKVNILIENWKKDRHVYNMKLMTN